MQYIKLKYTQSAHPLDINARKLRLNINSFWLPLRDIASAFISNITGNTLLSDVARRLNTVRI